MTERICSLGTCSAPALRRSFSTRCGGGHTCSSMLLFTDRRSVGTAEPQAALTELCSFPAGSPFGSLHIENLQNRAIPHRFPGTPDNGSRKQPFELHKIIDLGTDVVEGMFGDLAHFGTSRLFSLTKIEQGAAFIQTA